MHMKAKRIRWCVIPRRQHFCQGGTSGSAGKGADWGSVVGSGAPGGDTRGSWKVEDLGRPGSSIRSDRISLLDWRVAGVTSCDPPVSFGAGVTSARSDPASADTGKREHLNSRPFQLLKCWLQVFMAGGEALMKTCAGNIMLFKKWKLN